MPETGSSGWPCRPLFPIWRCYDDQCCSAETCRVPRPGNPIRPLDPQLCEGASRSGGCFLAQGKRRTAGGAGKHGRRAGRRGARAARRLPRRVPRSAARFPTILPFYPVDLPRPRSHRPAKATGRGALQQGCAGGAGRRRTVRPATRRGPPSVAPSGCRAAGR